MLRLSSLLFCVGCLAAGCTLVWLDLLPCAVLSAAPAPKVLQTVTVDLGDDVKMEFVLIPKGKFLMGSPKEEKERRADEVQHEVEITKPFYLAKYPVTQEQYLAITGQSPSSFSKDGKEAEKVTGLDTRQFPVEQVTWNDAQAFCKKLTEQDKQKRKFRLPTEAEWEYACRAGTTTPFYFGAELNGKQANCNGTVPYGTTDKGPSLGRPTKVGEYGANKWGLCDMHGNVLQWCEDYYGPYDGLNAQDPLQATKPAAAHRVLRGGSWYNNAWNARAACRNWDNPALRNSNWGFRVAMAAD